MLKTYVLIVLSFAISAVCQTQDECLSRDYGNGGTVCVCNSDHCDTIPEPEKLEPPQYLIYTSNKAGLRFQKDIGNFEFSGNAENQIIINSQQKYQKILGWGGAFTDSTGINIASLEESVQEKLLRSYFSEDGIEYNLCRVPIGGTDFSTHGYTYNDGDEDPELKNYALVEEDYKYKIPYIKKAFELTNNNLQLFASAWNAPKWMKTNGEYAGWGFIKPEMLQTWAEYFVKFLDAYQEEGISFWGITTGNEPNSYLVPENQIPTVGWGPAELGDWILSNLGPTIRSSNHSSINIMTLDDNRLFLPWFLDIILENGTASQYIDGIAVHFYSDFAIPATVLDSAHEHFPDKFILSTEACITIPLFTVPVELGSWERGEFYSNYIIEDLQHWVRGWVDWNMVLDLTGGPTFIDNLVDSPIIVNITAGEFYKQPMYYNLGHFSKFIPRESVRIDLLSDLGENVAVVAFQRPDNGTVVVILNKNEHVVPFSLSDETRGTANLELSEKSITTIVFW